ncbi:MAG: hypothetical protein ABL918_08170 [Chakrabartia sp.]
MRTTGAWWEQKWVLIAFILCAAIPLLWPTIPPLVDLPGHMGRYKVQIDGAMTPSLNAYYAFNWHLIGNLGVDILIIPLAKIFGLELAVKLIVTSIPMMTVAGMIWIAREVHGRVPPTTLFALPLAYGHPFIFGFVNFALAMALALLAFALWLRLARQKRFRLRAIFFFPIGLILWVCHTYGWGMLGVLAFSAELVRQKDTGKSFIRSGFNAAQHCLPLIPPLLLMIIWRSGAVGGGTGDWFNLQAKFLWLTMTLLDRWKYFDIASVLTLCFILYVAARDHRLEFSRNLGASAFFLLIVFLIIPRIVFGSAYADMRLTPYLFAIAIIAIRLRPSENASFAKLLALAGLSFLMIRMIATTISFFLYSQSYDRALAVIDHVPANARLISFVGYQCNNPWFNARLGHIPALAMIRKNAFSNDQWAMAGAQLLSVKKSDAEGFISDPSQIVTENKCPGENWRTLDTALSTLPRHAFDYILVINPPPFMARNLGNISPLWTNGRDTLYHIHHTPSLTKAPQ